MKNSFSINIVFLLFAVIGLALLPRLPIQLQPQRHGNTIDVTYSWYGMGAEVVEREVTSPIEGTLAALRGVVKVTSQSYKNGGRVSIEFKKGTDMDAVRFEVASLMRSLHPRLPQGVQLPQVRMNQGGSSYESLDLLIYTINGEGSSHSLQEYVAKNIVPHISQLEDISDAEIFGAQSLEWELNYDKNKLELYGLSVHDLQKAIQNHLKREELGQSTIQKGDKTETINLTFSQSSADSLQWEQIVVAKSGDRIIRLSDVAKPLLKESKPGSYFRVNGLNTIYLLVRSAKGANQLTLSKKVKESINRLKQGFPPNFSMLVNYDASEYIEAEVKKISSRALLAIIILLLFVLLISRKWRYLLIIALSLATNLAIAVIFYYMLGIEIHLYSLAGITVSLGMIIDNTIVMADHLRHSGNRKAFLAVLAATLTTMGALTIIFFLKEEQRLNLIDFAVVMLINLSVSLAVAFFFVPALMDRLPLKKQQTKKSIRRKKRVAKASARYQRFLRFSMKRRWIVLLIFIWAFGFPVFFLPDKLGAKENTTNYWEITHGNQAASAWYINLYNKTLGNQNYVQNVKPWVNKILGGSWYYFSSYYANQNFNWDDDSRTRLWARGSMPDGSTIHQMNDVFMKLENFLASFDEIELFTSTIYSIDNSAIEIIFKPEFESGSFPHQLKNMLVNQANQIGSSDFVIYGVGQSFSNLSYDNMKNNRLQLKGYNYDFLLQQATILRDSLLTNPRIQDVVIQTGISSWRSKPRFEFVMGLHQDKLEETGSSLSRLYYNLLFETPNDTYAGLMLSKTGLQPVVLREKVQKQTSVWALENHLLTTDIGAYRLKNVGWLKREKAGDVIRKENQEYELNVEYDFIGPHELNQRVREQYVKQVQAQLPLGFSLQDVDGRYHWGYQEQTQYWLLLIVVAIIFALCTILFESLLQPLAVISAIPIAFIGLFLTFTIFKINFDQGGYAAMVLLCGLTVNAALYIINDYNNLRSRYPNQKKFTLFLKAYNHKIIPILLTTFSTILGLMPFLLIDKNEGFWFSLAAGATGGLLFSLLAVLLWLPLILIKEKR